MSLIDFSCLIQSFFTRFVYRFALFYFFVTALPFPFSYLPYLNILSNWYFRAFNVLISWTGIYIFHIPFHLAPTLNGSGDTTYSYVRLFLTVILAIGITVFFCIREKKSQKSDSVLFYWITTYIRYWFAILMIRYGCDKIIKGQFPFPYDTLNKTYGDSPPARLLWNFMGYSTAYNIFIGVIEITAGTLVLFKKRVTLGLLLSMGMLTNIVALNFCYDVSVKIFSLNMLFTTFFLIAPDAKRLTNFFFRNKAVPAIDYQPIYKTNRMKRMINAVKPVLLVCCIYSAAGHSYLRYVTTGDGSFKRTPLFGIYDVKSFVSGEDSIRQNKPVQRWKTLRILSPTSATIEAEDSSIKKYGFITDTIKRVIKVKNESGDTSQLFYTLSGSDKLSIVGQFNNDSVRVMLQRQDISRYELLNRKFHWINEAPYK